GLRGSPVGCRARWGPSANRCLYWSSGFRGCWRLRGKRPEGPEKAARDPHEESVMKLQSACLVLGAALAFTAPAWAQSKAIPPASISNETSSAGTQQGSTGTGTQSMSTVPGTQASAGTSTRTTTSSTGAFQNLSPGGQRIAQSLFNSQHPPSGTQPRTLDQIAAMKGREGWGRVFKEMKADGLVQAKNLGQVVSGHAQTAGASTSTGMAGGRGTSGRASTAVSNGAGRGMSLASAGGRGSGRNAGGYSTHVTTGSGMYAGGMQGGPAIQGGGGGGFHGGGGGGGHGHGH